MKKRVGLKVHYKEEMPLEIKEMGVQRAERM